MNVVLDFIVGTLLIVYYLLESWVLFFVPARFRSKSIAGWTALVTGGGSGMGRLLCLELAKQGCRVVTLDVNQAGNEETVRMVKDSLRQQRANALEKKLTDGTKPEPNSSPPVDVDSMVYGYRVDLCNREDVYRVAELVKNEVGTVDLLVNNAGVVSGKPFLSTSDEQNLLTMNVNAISHFWTVKAFLPGMLEQNRGHIVTLASMAGHTGVNRLVDYCASKFAAVGFDEALRNELKAMGANVKTTCVCPYYVDTGMFEGVRSRILPILQADYVVGKIVEAILLNQEVIMLPRVSYFLIFFKSFFPVKSTEAAENFMEVAKTMSQFKGRTEGGMSQAAPTRSGEQRGSEGGGGKKSD